MIIIASRIATWLIFAIPITVIVGWVAGIDALKGGLGLTSMKVNTAICFLLIGLAEAAPSLRSVCVAAVALIAGVSLIEFATGREIIANILIPDTSTLPTPGLMSPLTATVFLLWCSAAVSRHILPPDGVRAIASAMVGICGAAVAFWFGAIPTTVIPFSQMSPLTLLCFGAVLWHMRDMAHG